MSQRKACICRVSAGKRGQIGPSWACRPAGWLIDRLRFSDLPGCCLLKSIQNFSRQQTADQEISQPAGSSPLYLNTLVYSCAARHRTSESGMRAWKGGPPDGIVYHSTANRRPGAPRLGWPGGCPTAPPMACPRHVAPPHPAVLAHVSRGASRFSCARPARGGAHVGKAVPCGLGGPREAVSGCLREAAGAELRRGRALRRGNTAPGICVRSVGDAIRRRSYGANPRL